MKYILSAFLLLFAASSLCAAQTDAPTLFQKPTVSRTHIVFVYAGDLWIVPREGGCDYKVENGRYRFAKIYNGENWNPQLRAPLTQPGVNVKAGDYLLAVNGREIRATDNVYQFFESTANKQVVIKVGPNPDGTGSREVTVVPIPNEGGLRNLAWIEGNRRKVGELSGGKLAYVYLPDTVFGSYCDSFVRPIIHL